jgi:hypothetical protein
LGFSLGCRCQAVGNSHFSGGVMSANTLLQVEDPNNVGIGADAVKAAARR